MLFLIIAYFALVVALVAWAVNGAVKDEIRRELGGPHGTSSDQQSGTPDKTA